MDIERVSQPQVGGTKAAIELNEFVDESRIAIEDFEPAVTGEEEKVIQKMDWNLMPLIFVLYSLSVLDRSNLGNAKLAGLQDDIDLKGNRYNWLGTVFYISYIVFQPSIVGFKHFKPHIWLAVVTLFWGFVASIQAAVTSWSGLMACRFFLGIAEACFGPGIPLYMTYFYPRDRVAFRHGIFISGAAAANAYGSALAYGISQAKGNIASWQILFLVEGLPTCCIAAICWFFIPDEIGQCRFLTEREKLIAENFVSHHQKADLGVNKAGLRFREFADAIIDPKSYVPALMYFGCNVSFASLPLFLPTIISEMGTFTPIQSNGLAAPPYAFCFIIIWITAWAADKAKMRGPFSATAALIAGIGFIILATTSTTGPRYAGCFLAVLIFVSVAMSLSWVASIHATESRRAGGYAILGLIGQCGPLLGTNVFPEDEKPFFRKGMWISAAMCLMVATLCLLLDLHLHRENKLLELLEESAVASGSVDVEKEKSQLATKGRFRYMY